VEFSATCSSGGGCGLPAGSISEENSHGHAHFRPAFGYTQGREAHFLYPWQGLFVQGSEQFKNGICNGTAFLDLTNR